MTMLCVSLSADRRRAAVWTDTLSVSSSTGRPVELARKSHPLIGPKIGLFAGRGCTRWIRGFREWADGCPTFDSIVEAFQHSLPVSLEQTFCTKDEPGADTSHNLTAGSLEFVAVGVSETTGLLEGYHLEAHSVGSARRMAVRAGVEVSELGPGHSFFWPGSEWAPPTAAIFDPVKLVKLSHGLQRIMNRCGDTIIGGDIELVEITPDGATPARLIGSFPDRDAMAREVAERAALCR